MKRPLLLAGLILAWAPVRDQGLQASAPAPTSELGTRLQERLDEYVHASRVPGVSVGVVLADGTVLGLAAGLADREQGRALTPDDVMCAGSTGKTFFAALALQLVQEEKLHLEDYAGEYLGEEPWFEHLPNATELTVENLMNHRSGLPRYEFTPEFTRDLAADPERVWRPEELLGYVLDHPAEVPANEGFAYADTNYIVLGMILERVSGARCYAEIQRRLLDPLQLGGVRAQDSRLLPGLVQGHAGPEDPLGLPELMLDEQGRFCINPQFEWAGGGYVTCGRDLARWAHALYAGAVLQPALRERMLTGELAPELGRGTRYGLGAILWSTRKGPAWGHSGFFPGYMSEMRYYPEARIAIAVQVNTSEFQALPGPLGRLCDELLALAQEG